MHWNPINWHATIVLDDSLTPICVNFDNTSRSIQLNCSRHQNWKTQSPTEFHGITGVIQIVKFKVERNSMEWCATLSSLNSVTHAVLLTFWPPDLCYLIFWTRNYIPYMEAMPEGQNWPRVKIRTKNIFNINQSMDNNTTALLVRSPKQIKGGHALYNNHPAYNWYTKILTSLRNSNPQQNSYSTFFQFPYIWSELYRSIKRTWPLI